MAYKWNTNFIQHIVESVYVVPRSVDERNSKLHDVVMLLQFYVSLICFQVAYSGITDYLENINLLSWE